MIKIVNTFIKNKTRQRNSEEQEIKDNSQPKKYTNIKKLLKKKIIKDDNPNNRKKLLVSSDHLAR